ncbi:ATP-dependent helicase HrpB, partial [Aurantiacibacter xanthus]
LMRWDGERSGRAEAARKLAQRWARLATDNGARSVRVERSRDTGGDASRLRSTRTDGGAVSPAILIARALPDNIARRRDPSGETWLSAGGRGYRLDPASPLARAEWLVIGDAQGQAKAARITAAAPLALEEIEQHLGHLIEKRSVARWNALEGRVEARRERRLGAITLASGPDPEPDPEAITALLVGKAVENLVDLLPKSLLARGRFAGIAALAPEQLAARADEWLAPLLDGKRKLDLPPGRYAEAARNLLSWDERQTLDRLAPRQFVSPAGTHHAIDYNSDHAPACEVRVQALFGLDQHPMIGTTPLLLQLTDPGGKPMQATRDLPGFWRGSWEDVRKSGKGRYPKHRWPDEPWAERPSLKTKNAFTRSNE